MSKHTPGPWSSFSDAVFSESKEIDKTKQTTRICIVSNKLRMPEEQKEANAKLIAAAPELLGVAKKILQEWEAPTEGVSRGELIARLSQYAKEAREAIAKAEGK